MKVRTMFLGALMFLALPAVPAFAHTPVPGFSGSQIDLERRLESGISSGMIDRNEARMLRNQFRLLERREDRFMADGRLTRNEQRMLQNETSRISRMIDRRTADRRSGDGSLYEDWNGNDSWYGDSDKDHDNRDRKNRSGRNGNRG